MATKRYILLALDILSNRLATKSRKDEDESWNDMDASNGTLLIFKCFIKIISLKLNLQNKRNLKTFIRVYISSSA